jgi:hypothetical protein
MLALVAARVAVGDVGLAMALVLCGYYGEYFSSSGAQNEKLR